MIITENTKNIKNIKVGNEQIYAVFVGDIPIWPTKDSVDSTDISGFLLNNVNSFRISSNKPIIVLNNGNEQSFSPGSNILVSGLDYTKEIKITFLNKSVDFRFIFLDDNWKSLKILDLGHCKSLNFSFSFLTQLQKFESEFDFSNISDISFSWYNCKSLERFPFINIENVQYLDYTWYGCEKIENFPELNLTTPISSKYTWSGCKNLKKIGYKNSIFLTNSENTEGLFQNTKIEKMKLETSSTENLSYMFEYSDIKYLILKELKKSKFFKSFLKDSKIEKITGEIDTQNPSPNPDVYTNQMFTNTSTIFDLFDSDVFNLNEQKNKWISLLFF